MSLPYAVEVDEVIALDASAERWYFRLARWYDVTYRDSPPQPEPTTTTGDVSRMGCATLADAEWLADKAIRHGRVPAAAVRVKAASVSAS